MKFYKRGDVLSDILQALPVNIGTPNLSMMMAG
jgi:hypothetical protein